MILYRREGINHGNKVHFMYTSAVESALCNTENLYSTSSSAVFNIIQKKSGITILMEYMFMYNYLVLDGSRLFFFCREGFVLFFGSNNRFTVFHIYMP